ncbi:MAG: hypothetical protein NC548_25575 [Lachnospiraceae bacterium]|nr:hypothetical protein [Lachnospiraceae bacterium]
MTSWQKVRSSAIERPLELDTTSGKQVVYERKNIHQEEFEMDMGDSNETITEWVYDERTYTREEYDNLNSATTQLLMQNISDMAVDLAILKEVAGNV